MVVLEKQSETPGGAEKAWPDWLRTVCWALLGLVLSMGSVKPFPPITA